MMAIISIDKEYPPFLFGINTVVGILTALIGSANHRLSFDSSGRVWLFNSRTVWDEK